MSVKPYLFSGYLFLLEDGDFVERNVWGQFVFETVDLDKLAVQFFLILVQLVKLLYHSVPLTL